MTDILAAVLVVFSFTVLFLFILLESSCLSVFVMFELLKYDDPDELGMCLCLFSSLMMLANDLKLI